MNCISKNMHGKVHFVLDRYGKRERLQIPRPRPVVEEKSLYPYNYVQTVPFIIICLKQNLKVYIT